MAREHLVPIIWRITLPRWEIECTQNILEEEKVQKEGLQTEGKMALK